MKKIIFVFVLALMSSLSFAQTAFEVGLRINPEFTTLSNKNDKAAGTELDYASHFSYLSLGVGGMYNFSGHAGIGLDVLFSREGQAFTGVMNTTPDSNTYSKVVAIQKMLVGDTSTGNYKALSELNFIKIPLMVSISGLRVKPVFFDLLIGPQINILQGVAQEIDGEDHEYPGTDITPKDLYEPVTFDGVLALGAGFSVMPNLLITAHLRFDYGFVDVEKKDVMVSYLGAQAVRFYSTGRSSTHNATAALMIGVNWRIGKIIKNGPYQEEYPR